MLEYSTYLEYYSIELNNSAIDLYIEWISLYLGLAFTIIGLVIWKEEHGF